MMTYNELGTTGLNVSRFGMGCMRLPKIEQPDGTAVIDQDKTNEMVRYAIDHGVNYFDTAYVYGGSEEAMGRALAGGLREKIVLVAKNPVWLAETYDDYERLLDEELERLQTDHLDIYLLHALNRARWDSVQQLGAIRFLEEMKHKGKIRHAGFSFHGPLALFKEIIDHYDWDMCQIQLNILDEKHQAGLEGLHYASDRGIPCVIMEPLRGGAMVNNIPDSVVSMIRDFPESRPPVEWAFRWLYDMAESRVILSGVSTLDQLKQNIEIFADAKAGSMSADEHALIESIKDAYKAGQKIGCTRCGYCLPCPQGVDIPEVFQLWNDMMMESYQGHCRFQYTRSVHAMGNGATECIECGQCEDQCPQELPIIESLKEAHKELLNPQLV
jgi:predicted aldo/keto reductase-like oxidoreductase